MDGESQINPSSDFPNSVPSLVSRRGKVEYVGPFGMQNSPDHLCPSSNVPPLITLSNLDINTLVLKQVQEIVALK